MMFIFFMYINIKDYCGQLYRQDICCNTRINIFIDDVYKFTINLRSEKVAIN